MKRLCIIILLLVAGVKMSWAQYDMQLSQYYMALGYYNPAYAGATGKLNVMALGRLQWLGFEGAPKSFFVMADMPLKIKKTNHGIGLAIFTDGVGMFQNTHVGFQYAYKQKLFGGVLSGGLQLGLVNQSFDGEKVHYPNSQFHQQEDEAIPTEQVNGMGLDINVGLYYQLKNFYAGIGMTHVNQVEIDLDEYSSMYLASTYNFIAGYNIKFANPLYELQPSVFLKTDFNVFQADVTARLWFNQMFSGGLSWRVNEAVVLLLGAQFGKFKVGYAYDFPTNPVFIHSTSGSHELVLSYSLQLKKTKKGKNRHKSVRIL